MLLVEQNANMALSVADRGYVLETGHLVTEGRPDECGITRTSAPPTWDGPRHEHSPFFGSRPGRRRIPSAGVIACLLSVFLA